ncbi:MAG: M28 family peptidase [Lachnospiraceae bacterium]|nr:M28 family peptidase [Lachnospiraceae bacterium]
MCKLTQDELIDKIKLDFPESILLKDAFNNISGILLKSNLYDGKKATLVAHLDTVAHQPPFDIRYLPDGNLAGFDKSGNQTIAGFDDRAGVFAAIGLYQKFPEKFNILFTTDEEKGCIGASNIVENQDYIRLLIENTSIFVEIDRRRDEGSSILNYVTYSHNLSKGLSKHLQNSGFVEMEGSYSDISVLMEATDIGGFNITAGYENEHTRFENLNLKVLKKTIEFLSKFRIDFVEKFKSYYTPNPVDDILKNNIQNGKATDKRCVDTKFPILYGEGYYVLDGEYYRESVDIDSIISEVTNHEYNSAEELYDDNDDFYYYTVNDDIDMIYDNIISQEYYYDTNGNFNNI